MPSTPWFYTAIAPEGNEYRLDEASSRHCVQVLRMQPNEAVVLTDGMGHMWEGLIAEADKRSCVVRLVSAAEIGRQTARRCGIAISPVKNSSRLEWLLEKASELGVADIFLVNCTRTEKTHLRFDRLVNITISAMLQSQQAWLPRLHPSQTFEKLVTSSNYHHRWIAHCEPLEKHHLSRSIQQGMEDSLVLIGPEGDFTREEISHAQQHGFVPVSLGETRLRTETAGMAAAALCCLL